MHNRAVVITTENCSPCGIKLVHADTIWVPFGRPVLSCRWVSFFLKMIIFGIYWSMFNIVRVRLNSHILSSCTNLHRLILLSYPWCRQSGVRFPMGVSGIMMEAIHRRVMNWDINQHLNIRPPRTPRIFVCIERTLFFYQKVTKWSLEIHFQGCKRSSEWTRERKIW